ncbi:MAG: hypothetical protein ACRDDA_13550, partial [Aeromonas sp.]
FVLARNRNKEIMTDRLTKMDSAVALVHLQQGNRTLEDHTQDFIDIANSTNLPDCILIDFFFYRGLNEPLQTTLARYGPRGSLCQAMDVALVVSGSSFTVGEEEASPKYFWGAACIRLRGPRS